MLPILLLLGMAPIRPLDADLPLVPHLDRRADVQWKLGNTASWRSFRTRWGGRWAARWDERNGTPRFLYSPGIPLSRDLDLAEDVAALAGVDPAGLVDAGTARRGEHTVHRWTRTWRGAPVEGDEIAIFAQGGHIGGVWVRLTPIGLRETPEIGEIVLPLPGWKGGSAGLGPATGVQPVLARRGSEGHFITYTDRSGRVVQRIDQRSYATVEVSVQERTVGDAMVTRPARDLTVTDASGGTDVTAVDGSHGLSGELEVALSGPSLTITTDGASIAVSGIDDFTIIGGEDVTQASATLLHHFHVVWDWLEARWPTHRWLGANVPANVDVSSDACNAYYTSGTLTFFRDYPEYCTNFGEIADVVYHETGHGIHHYILEAGTFAGDVSEGSSDYVAATILDDPELAPGAWPDGGYIREIDTDKVYPDDIVGESHTDGLVWASVLWNLRGQWADTYGKATGVEMTDLLFLGALEQGPTLTDAYEAVILADDDDGDLSNGTPHACELTDLLNHHGIGPGPIGVVVFDHEPLGPQGSSVESYDVSFDLYALTADCADFDEDSVQLWYTTENLDAPGTESGADTTGWSEVTLSRSVDTWTGTIPRQFPATRVRYFMQASSTDGTQTVMTHAGHDAYVYEFWVGDREERWCERFESDPAGWSHDRGMPDQTDGLDAYTDQWAYGEPSGGAFDPATAWEGSSIAGTNLDGEYLPDNLQYLLSSGVDATDPGRMFLLTYRRWLTVEDGIYDHAYLLVRGDGGSQDLLWENPSSTGGSDHVLDGDWVLHEIDLAPFVADGGPLAAATELQFAWTLSSDPGLEFGGWQVDEVCLVQLADLPGHYRSHDLSASDRAQTITVAWTTPYIAPLRGSVLVRNRYRWPEGPEDGRVLLEETDPAPGATNQYVDTEVLPGVSYHYVLFVADQGEDGEPLWYSDVVEGENADIGIVPDLSLRRSDPPTDTGDTGGAGGERDTATPGDGDDAQKGGGNPGCGCNSATPAGTLALLLVPLLAVGQRRR